MNKTNKKWLKFWIKVLVSLFFLGWVFVKVNWPEFFMYLAAANFWLILLYTVVLILGMVISAYKWQVLANFKGLRFSLWELFKLYLTGTFINNFMPSFVGGDTYRAYEIGRAEKKYTAAASTVMMDRITGLVAATALAVVFTLFDFKVVLKNNILIVANILVLLSFSSDILIAQMRKSAFIKRHAVRFLPEKIVEFLHELGHYSKHAGILRRTIVLGGVFSLVGVALANYILFLALGIKISLLNYMAVIFLITIVSSLPIVVNNIGLKGWSYITFFGLFGINASLVLVVSVIGSVIQMIVSFAALPMYLKSRN